METVSFITPGAEHCALISEIESDCFSNPWKPDSISSMLANPSYVFELALSGKKPAGYICSLRTEFEAEILRIAVKSTFRRNGIASLLMKRMMDYLLEFTSTCSVFLEVNESNASAIGLYGKKGFLVTGTRKNYYGSASALLMKYKVCNENNQS